MDDDGECSEGNNDVDETTKCGTPECIRGIKTDASPDRAEPEPKPESESDN